MAVPNVFRRGGPTVVMEKVATAAMAAGYVEELSSADQFVGIWTNDVASGALGALEVAGIYEMVKADTTLTVAVGAPVALTLSAGEASAGGATGGFHRAAAAAAAADAKILVLINANQ